jgi:hypothetical protein
MRVAGAVFERFGFRVAEAALSTEVVRRERIEEFLFWRFWDLRWRLSARYPESVSDPGNFLLVGEEGEDTHLTFAAGTLERVNLKEALHARRPAHGRSFVGFLGHRTACDRRALHALPPCSTGIPPIVTSQSFIWFGDVTRHERQDPGAVFLFE